MLETVSKNKSFDGEQGVYKHTSTACNCEMTFAVYTPAQAMEKPCPVLWYLSGLTCTHANVMEKGEYRRAASEHGIVIVCPDTSPRGSDVADEPDNWQFGSGAGFYLNATQKPYDRNYNMYSYIVDELPNLVAEHFNVDMSRQSIFGHSMGGHGALTIALKNSDRYKSCSGFAPICEPSAADWSSGAFEKYLGSNQEAWREYDAVALIEDGAHFSPILVDQGAADGFLDGLRPESLVKACEGTSIELTSRMHDGYDHSYYFISSFMHEHIAWHSEHLK